MGKFLSFDKLKRTIDSTKKNIPLLLIYAFLPWTAAAAPYTFGIDPKSSYFNGDLQPAFNLYIDSRFEDSLNSLQPLEGRNSRRFSLDRLYLLKGLNLQALGNCEEAVKQYQRSLEFRQSKGDALFFTGLCYLNGSSYPEALKSFEEAVWLKRSSLVTQADSQYYLALAQKQAGLPEKALATTAALLNNTPDYAPARALSAEIALERGDRGQALSQLRQAVQKDPSAKNRVTLAKSLLLNADPKLQAKDIGEAKQLALDSMNGDIKGHENDEAYSVYATALIRSGELETAQKVIKQGLKKAPENTELQRLSKQVEAQS